jgi:hypothetical protein
MVYLRGLLTVLDHVRRGTDLWWLYMGKIAASHIPIVQELMSRRVLRRPPLVPRYLERPEALERLERLRQGVRVHELAE